MMGHLLARWSMDRYFTRGVGPWVERTLRGHLEGCPPCRQRYHRHQQVEALLPDGGRLEEERLWRSIRAAAPGAAPRTFGALVFGLAVATAALVLLPRLHREPTARGTAVAVAPSVHLYRVVGPGRSEPVGDQIARHDGLLVAYSNPGEMYDRLMVFAIDERYQLYWFYPAFQRAGEDPEAVPIAHQRAGVELGEEISHPFPPGKLRLVALFLDRPLRVSQVEALVGELAVHGLPLENAPSLPLPGAHEQSRMLEVTP
jgi:hypothetical protein